MKTKKIMINGVEATTTVKGPFDGFIGYGDNDAGAKLADKLNKRYRDRRKHE